MKTYPTRYKDRFSEERTTILDNGEALSMVVRGVRFRGNDFDGFEPQDVADLAQLSSFTFLHGSLCFCTIEADIALRVVTPTGAVDGLLTFELELGEPLPTGQMDRERLILRLAVNGQSYSSDGKSGWFEDEMLDVQRKLFAGRLAFRPQPVIVATRAATSDLVAVGRITAIEPGDTEVTEAPGGTDRTAYRVAILRIEEALTDAGGQRHVRIGYDPVGPNARHDRTLFDFRMREEAAGVFFLTRHPSGSFYVLTRTSPPLEVGEKTFKEDLELVRKTTGALADPVKALMAADAKDRYFAAGVLVTKYRTPPMDSPGEAVAVAADESKLILQAIANAGWAAPEKDVPTPYQTFVTLGLTTGDKWTPTNAEDGVDTNVHVKSEFATWLAVDGRDYRVKRYVRTGK